MGDLILAAEVRRMLACEVGFIVGDNGMRKPEVINNVLQHEFHYLLSFDFGEWHRLYPLGEVVGGYREESELGQSSWERAHYIEPLLHEGPGVLRSVKVFAQSIGGGNEPLTLWALSYLFLGVSNILGQWYSWLMTLWARDRLRHDLHSRRRESPILPSWPPRVQGISNMDHSIVQELHDKYVHGGRMLELLCFYFVIG